MTINHSLVSYTIFLVNNIEILPRGYLGPRREGNGRNRYTDQTMSTPHLTIRDEPNRITRDEIFDVLSNSRRVCVLRYLGEVDQDIVKLRDVVDYVAACEQSGSVEDVDYKNRKSVYTALRQTHLPKLDERGVIEFNKARGELRLAERADQVQLYLESDPENDIPWHLHYLGLTLLSGCLVLTTYLGVYPFGLEWSHLTGIVFFMFSVSAIVHSFHARGTHREDPDFEPVGEVT